MKLMKHLDKHLPPQTRALGAAAILLGLGTFLLLFQLDSKSLWTDELYTVTIACQPDFGQFFASYLTTERQPPLHYLVLYLVVKATGNSSDLVVRLPSVLAGIGSILIFFLLGRALMGNNASLLASFLLTMSPFFILYSRMARYYAFMLFFALLSSWLFFLWIRPAQKDYGKGQRMLIGAGYSLATILMLFSGYSTLAILLCQNVYAGIRACRFRAILRPWLVSQGVILLAFLLWVGMMWKHVSTYAWLPSLYAFIGWKSTLLKIVYPLYAFTLGETLFPWNILAILGLLLSATLIVRAVRAGPEPARSFALLFFSLSFLSTVGIFIFFTRDLPFVSLASRSIFSFPFLFLLLAAGLLSFNPWPRATFLTALMLVLGYSLSSYYSNQGFHNPIQVVPAREMVQLVLTNSDISDVVISDWDSAFGYYYPKGPEVPRHFFTSEEVEVGRYLTDHGVSRVWLVTLGRDGTRALTPEKLILWLEDGYQEERSWGYAAQDATYRWLKELILGYPSYEYKATVKLYRKR